MTICRPFALALAVCATVAASCPTLVEAATAAAPAAVKSEPAAQPAPLSGAAKQPTSQPPVTQQPAVQKPAATPLEQSETQDQLTAKVKTLGDRLTAIEKEADGARVRPEKLGQLSTEIAPIVTETQAMVDRLTPRAAAMKARLDQLGAKTATETPETAAERETLQKTFEVNDGLLKRAKVLALKAQQDSNYIGKRQREAFTRSLFQRSTSIASPPLWFSIIRDSPSNLSDLITTSKVWLSGFNRTLTGGKLVLFWSLVLLVVLLYWPLTRGARYLVRRETGMTTPSDWQKILVALWTAVTTAGLVVACMYGVIFVVSFFATPNPEIMPLFSAMQWSVIRVSIAAGLARAILAPDRPNWRLVGLDERSADKLIRIVVGVAVIVSGTRIIEAVNEIIYASLDFTVAVRGVGSLLVAIALAVALIDLGDDAEDTPETLQDREWFGLIRAFVWTLVVVITVAAFVGYIPFASFLVQQVTLVAAVGAVLFLLVRLLDEACEIAFKPSSRVGRTLIHAVGLRRETLDQLPILIAGAGRVVLFVLAAIIVAAPWGMQSADIAGNLSALFFGFKVGDVTISIAGIIVAVISFLVVLAATRAIQNWLEDRYLPTTRLDSGLRNSIKTSLGYVGFLIAIAIAAENLGVDFQKLAIVAGALSVGIGFGLQSIVNNFVSGLILLWERAVRVGDWVVVGADQGYVRKINVRSTEIETFDRAAVIVPNSNLVSGVVKNLMRADKVGRLTIEVSVHASADPEKVREVLIDIARDNENILSLPAPQVRFTNLTSAAMTFDLFCFVSDVEAMARTKSDLYFEICRQFRQNHFFDGPAPDPTAIAIVGLDRLEDAIMAARPDLDPVRTRKAG